MASGGWIFAALQALLGHLERKCVRRDQHIFEALQWFGGGTQKRNIGISIVEGHWEEVSHLGRVLVTLLVNQAIYLLTHSKEGASSHEYNNLQRIMRLLLDSVNLKDHFPMQYKDFLAAVEMRYSEKAHGGIDVSPQELESWKKRLS